jgi:hypothetical protein
MAKKVVMLALTVIALAGCTVMREFQIVPQSHFTPPNSNVEPIGVVRGTASSTTLMFPDMSSQLIEQAVSNALQKKGGDLLINVKVSRKATQYLFVYSTSVDVEGTAVRMKVGQKRLSELREEQVERLARDASATTSR